MLAVGGKGGAKGVVLVMIVVWKETPLDFKDSGVEFNTYLSSYFKTR